MDDILLRYFYQKINLETSIYALKLSSSSCYVYMQIVGKSGPKCSHFSLVSMDSWRPTMPRGHEDVPASNPDYSLFQPMEH